MCPCVKMQNLKLAISNSVSHYGHSFPIVGVVAIVIIQRCISENLVMLNMNAQCTVKKGG